MFGSTNFLLSPTPNQPCALVTGASSGIGKEYARLLALKYKFNIVGIGRNISALDELKSEIESLDSSVCVETFQVDLAKCNELEDFSKLVSNRSDIGVLVNNAGYGLVGATSELDTDSLIDMNSVNMTAPLVLLKAVIPQMKKAQNGAIINISSVMGFQPAPYMANYAATKSYLNSLSSALRQELKGSGVVVLTQCPGPTKSNFHLRAGLSEKIKLLPAADPRTVAEAGLVNLGKNTPFHIPFLSNKILCLLSKLLPFALSISIAERLLRSYSTISRHTKNERNI